MANSGNDLSRWTSASFHSNHFIRTALVLFVGLTMLLEEGDAADANKEESKTPPYTLPDPLINNAGQAVSTPDQWTNGRREELFQIFSDQVYGKSLAPPKATKSMVNQRDAIGGKAIRKEVRLEFSGETGQCLMDLTIYQPKNVPGPLPVFVGIHVFDKNHHPPLPGGRIVKEGKPIPEGIDPKLLPGAETIQRILDRGYAVATIEPDGISADDAKTYLKGALTIDWPADKKARTPNDPGALSAWAWAISRAVDYFATDKDFDATKVIAIGHSRRGKAALWAGANDPRLAAVISNESGCGGAALSKRIFGETVAHINDRFPHWFCENFRQYNDHEDKLPVDQHELIALIAPRPVYIGSAEQDLWADPRGEFLSALHADPVYRLLGTNGMGGVKEMPPLNKSVGETIGYHVRSGEHNLSDLDWMLYLDWADRVIPKGAN